MSPYGSGHGGGPPPTYGHAGGAGQPITVASDGVQIVDPGQPSVVVAHAVQPVIAQPVIAQPVASPLGAASHITMTPVAGAPTVLVPGEATTMWTDSCWHFCCVYFVVVMAIFIVAIGFAIVGLGPIGVVLLSLAPILIVGRYAIKWYGPYVTQCSLWVVVTEATLYIAVPLIIVISVVDLFISLPEDCEGGEADAWKIAFQAFIRAGLLEETVKYVCVRRVVFRPYITDARAVLAYACLAGTTFGAVENIGYGLIAGIGTVLLRSFLTVFAHATTGMLMGADLAEWRFREGEGAFAPWYRVLFIPVVAHGVYDVFLFAFSAYCSPRRFYELFVAALLLLAAGVLYARKRVLDVLRRCPQTNSDVHDLIETGAISKPCYNPDCADCCTCCACCY